MATKLDATRVALDKGFTGVSDPTATLSSISKGMQDIASWKKGIDDAEIKLKTDTAQAYQDAKKLAAERMTGNKTVDAAILEALRSTQDRLYDNMKMVQKGMQTPTDNLIFRQNASSSYDILSSYLQDYDANFQQSLKEMQGYIDEKTGEYVKPTGGSLQAAIQKFNTTLGNPNLYKIVSSENGSLNLNLFKTKIDPTTNTRQLVLDENNNPIVDPSMSGIGASTLLKGKNQKALRVYMDDNINEALAKDTALSKAFQVMQTAPGYTGIVVDDARNNPEIKRLIDTAAISGTTTSEQRFSILADNMPSGQEQIPVMPNEVDSLKSQGVDLNEKVEYTYLDPETGETKTGTYNKYVMVVLDPMSNLFMPKETEEAKLASERIYKTAIYSGLERKITGKDKTPVFRPYPPGSGEEDENLVGSLIRKVVRGDKKALETLMRTGNVKLKKPNFRSEILDDGSIQFFDQDNNKLGEPVKFSETKDDKKTFLSARDVAVQLASIFGLNPDKFDQEIKFNEGELVKEGGLIKFGKLPEVKMTLDSTVSGRGNSKVTLNDGLTEAIKTADKDSNLGFTGSVLASGVEENLTQALLNSGQELESSPKVRFDKNKEIMTITAVNNKGKTITITRGINDEDNGEAQKVKAMVTEFLSNINSDEDYTSGGGVDYTQK